MVRELGVWICRELNEDDVRWISEKLGFAWQEGGRHKPARARCTPPTLASRASCNVSSGSCVFVLPPFLSLPYS
jgi:hypothetical protein